jgi:hypothetical protein
MMQITIYNQHYEPVNARMDITFFSKKLTLRFNNTNDFFFDHIKIGTSAKFAGRKWTVKQIYLIVWDNTNYTEVTFA